MPKIITVTQQKGGAGKTTLTSNLGIAFALKGYKVVLFDLDPQSSLGLWHEVRTSNGLDVSRLDLKTSTSWRASTDVRMQAKDADIVLIDTPPHAEASAKHSIKIADLVLVPSQLSAMDIWASQPILNMIAEENVPAKMVLNRVPPQGRIARDLKESLKQNELPLMKAEIGNRMAYISSFLKGSGVMETESRSSAAFLEMTALLNEIALLIDIPELTEKETVHKKPTPVAS